MVEWLAGNRIRGTSTERTTTSGFNPISVISGGWKELDRTTLGSAGDTISVSSLDDKRYYMILGNIKNTGGDTVSHVRANSDSSGNYALRRAVNGTEEPSSTGTNRFMSTHNSKSVDSRFIQGYIANKSDKEKLGIFNVVENPSTGAGTAPSRIEGVGKHAQTSSALNELQLFNDEAGSFDTGGELVVLGYDPDDTHTDNFWEELASVDLSGGEADEISSGTITAKKYLWVQYYREASGVIGGTMQFNDDTGSNYAVRYTNNGLGDSAYGSQSHIELRYKTTNTFGNMFIINNSANEKLVIMHEMYEDGSGAGNYPSRTERVGKWVPTTNQQITKIDINNDQAGNFGTKTMMKVWGSN